MGARASSHSLPDVLFPPPIPAHALAGTMCADLAGDDQTSGLAHWAILDKEVQ